MSLLAEAQRKAAEDREAAQAGRDQREAERRTTRAEQLTLGYGLDVVFIHVRTVSLYRSRALGPGRNPTVTDVDVDVYLAGGEVYIADHRGWSDIHPRPYLLLPCDAGCGRPALSGRYLFLAPRDTPAERRGLFVEALAQQMNTPPTCGLCTARRIDARCSTCGRGW